MAMSRVDVVVPCYNYGRFLRDCVKSVTSQRDVDVRVLIIDDCSSDDTPTVGAELALADHRVTFRRHEQNRGHIATYNEGLLEWARGDYCLLLSADDMLAPGALWRAASVMDAHPTVGLVFGDAPKTIEPEALFGQFTEPATYRTRIYGGRQFLELVSREAWNLVPTPTALVRTALQKTIGGYRHELPHSGDMEMWLRCGAHGDVAGLDATQAFYRLHRTQMSTGYVGVDDLRGVRAAFESVFTTFGGQIADVEGLRRLAGRGLALRTLRIAGRLFESGAADRCQAHVDLAVEFDAHVVAEREWRSLRYKRLLGPRIWGLVKPIAQALRSIARKPTLSKPPIAVGA
jgi:glycosyltransferase involved in cell wall biosynthesis